MALDRFYRLICVKKITYFKASKLYDEMNAFICDERERLNREMTSQLLTKLQREQSEKEIEIKILQRDVTIFTLQDLWTSFSLDGLKKIEKAASISLILNLPN